LDLIRRFLRKAKAEVLHGYFAMTLIDQPRERAASAAHCDDNSQRESLQEYDQSADS
jgi:hypothetical protein